MSVATEMSKINNADWIEHKLWVGGLTKESNVSEFFNTIQAIYSDIEFKKAENFSYINLKLLMDNRVPEKVWFMDADAFEF